MTTANETSAGFNTRKDALEAELAIEIGVVTRNEFVELVMAHMGTMAEM